MLGSCRALASAPGYRLRRYKKHLHRHDRSHGSCGTGTLAQALVDIHDVFMAAAFAVNLQALRPGLRVNPEHSLLPTGRTHQPPVPHDKFTTIQFFRQRFSLPCVYCSTRFQDRSRACACARERQPLRSPLGRCSWRSCRRRNRSPAGSAGPREPGTGCQWRRSRPSTAPAAGAGPTGCGNSSTAAGRWG